jgi:hypothetical protein
VIGHRRVSLLPVQKVDVTAMELSEPFGWLDLVTDAESIVTAQYGVGGRSGVPVQAFCLPAEARPLGPGLQIEQLVNGEEAAVPPGPAIPVGNPITWMYTVTNTGDAPLDFIVVSSNLGLAVECPESSLDRGEAMTCVAAGVSEACPQEVTATATGIPPSEPPVVAQDTSYYVGDEGAALDFELMVYDEDADSDEAGHPFRREGGHPFRGESGHPAGACGEQGSWWIEVAALRPVNGL